MKVLGLFALLICLAGCGSAGALLSNMQQTNEKMEANIVLLKDVRVTVLENTAQVERSTAEVRHFQKVNAANIEGVTSLIKEVDHYDVHRLAILGLFLMLILPSIILATSYFKWRRR